MTSITDIIASLRDILIDWNGDQLPDRAEPRSPPTCGDIAAVLDALEKAANRERELAKHLERAVEALEPLSDAVFNDNGDITTNIPTICADDCEQAYFVSRAARRFIEAHTGGDDAE